MPEPAPCLPSLPAARSELWYASPMPSNVAPYVLCSLTNDWNQYALGGYRMQARRAYGTELALLASVVLAGSSIPRAIRSQKPLPIGLSVLATLGLYTFGTALYSGKDFKTA